ncbi:double-strand break repair protein AddB [Jannaschia sp. LMIT008]|uniref:double-strand break repair protein AddB n=1 Tax=Jannaschia maritima TaxID=3032585 RepID=UPI0028113ABF|nr:double-strand break repair protein AddB [Jannaschia sp. LMIT008]
MTLWYEPLGVDFSAAFVDGVLDRMAGRPPEAMAALTILLPNRRMLRRVEETFAARGPTLLPRLGTVADLTPLCPHRALPAARSALSLRLEMATLIERVFDARPNLRRSGAAFELAGTLGALIDELREEAVPPGTLEGLDVTDSAQHWQDALRLLRIASDLADQTGGAADAQMDCLAHLEATWPDAPPAGGVIVAGSTGSRGPTLRLMKLVAALPGGDVVLPGLDTDMPDDAWDRLGPDQQDHPQTRHRMVLDALGLTRADVAQWSDAARHAPANPARNRLVSLALRPAPITDIWPAEGGDLAHTLHDACEDVTLLEADTPLQEAQVIALRMRAALHDGQRAALVSNDRTLSREVAACLDRWGIVPDDSAGRPLDLTPPGRLMVQTARMRGRPVDTAAFVALLKHPLVHTGSARNEHLRRTRDLELGWLRGGPPRPDAAGLRAWARAERTRGKDDVWTDWVADLLSGLNAPDAETDLATRLARHRAVLENLSRGSGLDAHGESEPGRLWEEKAGEDARAAMDELAADAEGARGLKLRAPDYARLVASVLNGRDVRDPIAAHPDLMIWGAMEARVQGADLVILGGLNDGTWPDLPPADMWLNRRMRRDAGLRAPERTVGLAAHDFQQAVAGRKVWLTRARRTLDTPTVPSRWVNRLVSLLDGLGDPGRAALAAMRGRAAAWSARAGALSAPDARHAAAPAPRPAPVPPPDARPRELPVTGVETLIRDPYATYARYVLDLRALDPLAPITDARLRGNVVHDALRGLGEAELNAAQLMDALERELARAVPGPAQRSLWLGRFARIADTFATQEGERRATGAPVLTEQQGRLDFPDLGFTLTARPDRLDHGPGGIAIYDYKTGEPPGKKDQERWAKQLWLQAVMVAEGAFDDLPARDVAGASYLQVGRESKARDADGLDADAIAAHRDGLVRLVEAYRTTAPFYARLTPESLKYPSDYDHLSRRGEWDDTAPAVPQPVGAHP